jgi:hypothetical protein
VDRRLLGQLGHVGADPQRLWRGGARHNGAVQREQERSRRKGESVCAYLSLNLSIIIVFNNVHA